jgi:hypothetical protein
MKTTIILGVMTVLVGVAGFYLGGHNYRNIDAIKSNAPRVWEEAGFEIVSCWSYRIGHFGCPGGRVWYTVRRMGPAGILYQGMVAKWGSEYRIYHLRAIDALASATT